MYFNVYFVLCVLIAFYVAGVLRVFLFFVFNAFNMIWPVLFVFCFYVCLMRVACSGIGCVFCSVQYVLCVLIVCMYFVYCVLFICWPIPCVLLCFGEYGAWFCWYSMF